MLDVYLLFIQKGTRTSENSEKSASTAWIRYHIVSHTKSSLLQRPSHANTSTMIETSGLYAHSWPLSPVSFSASPWALFFRIWTATTSYPPTSFDFIPGTTPMSTAKETAIAISCYYLMILIGRKWMQSRPAFELTSQFLLHNFFLSVLSAFLLLLFAEELVPGLWKRGMYYSICGAGGWTERLVTLYYVSSHQAARDMTPYIIIIN